MSGLTDAVKFVKELPTLHKVLLGTAALALGWLMYLTFRSGFENNPNGIRRYIVATDGISLDDKMHNAQRSSGLTGSRDAPVFFSDYDIEMRKDANGDLVADRSESFVDEKVTDVTNIESRFMLN